MGAEVAGSVLRRVPGIRDQGRSQDDRPDPGCLHFADQEKAMETLRSADRAHAASGSAVESNGADHPAAVHSGLEREACRLFVATCQLRGDARVPLVLAAVRLRGQPERWDHLACRVARTLSASGNARVPRLEAIETSEAVLDRS